ncbi:sporulation membrane protein YtaF [Desmospora activa]|uniref:Putative sporulation protein YtaF n=1 Tax=Desmospora activa DSM 45169 TaxID=1121389 RepID=A0A2T4Z8B1_9BACL|nr:sporulation membrane protein YtaF [Desmospora activa]PTM58114.1 putative sporulation protein YtaF [Desmospora activa DSM 45169]
MWTGFSLLLLAVALSLDSFGAGITYGLRQIRIPILSIVIIALCSGCMIVLSMMAGQWLSRWLSPEVSDGMGAGIMIGIGLFALWNASRKKTETDKKDPIEASMGEKANQRVFTLEFRTLGYVVQILKTPTAADMDRSGTISPVEAVMLGLALSLDAFGAGFGAALLGFSPWLTAVMIAVVNSLFLIAGMRAGFRLYQLQWARTAAYLPGILLMGIGVSRLFL